MLATLRKSACCTIIPPIGSTERKIFTKEMIMASTAGHPLNNCKSVPTPHSMSGKATKREAAPNRLQRLVWRMDALA
eukprot:scaffold224427_cov16-Tisochrysis_lutea.AAC.1